MNMELTRSQYKQLLENLDNNISTADKIADLIEKWTMPTSQNSVIAPFPPEVFQNLNVGPARNNNEVARTFDGRDPRKIGGITE